MTQAKKKSPITVLLLLIIGSFFQPLAYAERLLFSTTLSQLDSALPNNSTQQTNTLKHRLTTQNDLKSAFTRLLLAKRSYLENQHEVALAYVEQAIDVLQRSEAPQELANGYYIRAIITSIGQRQYPTAIPQFKQVLTISAGDKQPLLQLLHVKTYQKLGSLLMFLKQPQAAHDYIIKAVEAAQNAKETSIEIDARLDLAKYYLGQHQTTLAEAQLMLAHKLSVGSNDTNLKKVLIQISRFYRKMKRYDLAIKYGERAIKSIKESSNLELLAWAYNSLAITYEDSGDFNMALVQFLNALHHANERKSLFSALAQHNIGLIYIKQQRLDQAQPYLIDANKMFSSIEHPYYLMHSHLSLGELYTKQGKFEQAIARLNEALEAAKSHQDSDTENQAHQQLIIAYRQSENFRLANQHHQALNDSLKLQVNTLIMAQQTELDAIKKTEWQQQMLDSDVTITRLKQQQKKSHQRLKFLNYCLAIGGLLFILSLILYCYYINKKRRTIAHSQRNNISGLPQLDHGSMLVKALLTHYRKEQLLVTIRVRLLGELHRHFNQQQAHQLYHQWMTNITSNISGKLFCLNDSILVCAITSQLQETPDGSLDTLFDTITQAAPAECAKLMETDYGLAIGATSLAPFLGQPNANEASNTVNLALTMLAGIESVEPSNKHHHWLLAKPKEQSQSSIFNFCSRQEWVYSIKNNLILFESNRHIEIDWDRIFIHSEME